MTAALKLERNASHVPKAEISMVLWMTLMSQEEGGMVKSVDHKMAEENDAQGGCTGKHE